MTTRILLLFSLLAIGASTFAQVELWATTRFGGGLFNDGSLFKVDENGDNYQQVHGFEPVNPGYGTTRSQFMLGANGNFYGVTRSGGYNNQGTIVEYNPVSEEYKTLYQFNSNEASSCEGRLMQLANGKLYGAGSWSGANSDGTLFEFDLTTNTLTVLHHFDEVTDGRNPLCDLSFLNGKIYGVTQTGGANNQGVIFSFDTTSNVLTNLHDFNGTNGWNPKGGMILGTNGMYFGTTVGGGANGDGVLFALNPMTEAVSVLANFDDGTTGDNPVGSLVQAADGLLYGVTESGGANSRGVLYSFDPALEWLQSVHHFGANAGDPRNPYAGVYEGTDGRLYGTTRLGGNANDGTLYAFDPTLAALTVLYEIPNNLQGYSPSGAVVENGTGEFLSFCDAGGYTGSGTFFKYDLTAGFEVIAHLEDYQVGANPWYGGVLQASNGKVYGLTDKGGTDNRGVIFEYDFQMDTIVAVHHFDDFNVTNGEEPVCGLIEASNGLLYGMTEYGGVNDRGTIYSFDPNTYVLNVVHSFDQATTGKSPQATELMQASNGKLYGVAQDGGINDLGTLFEFDITNNSLVVLFHFDGTNGNDPRGSLVETAPGILYGTTRYGGTNNEGVIYIYDLNTGTYSVVLHCDGAGLGADPHGPLLHATNGDVYGVMRDGGANDDGLIYRLDTATNVVTIIHDFETAVDGSSPQGGLTQSPNGKIYGYNTHGGSGGEGVLFELDPANGDAFTSKYGFQGSISDGDEPKYGRLSIVCVPQFSNINETACGSYTTPSGNATYTQTGVYMDTIPTVAGCDSILTINVTINQPTTGTDVITACKSYTWIDGNTYTSSNASATHTLQNAIGCDSVVTLNLTINTVDVSTTTVGETITAGAANATSYQWIDCSDNSQILGETNQSFTATANGDYAVIVTENNCTDTSACENILTVGLANLTQSDFKVYPNPTNTTLSVEFSDGAIEGTMHIRNSLGVNVYTEKFVGANKVIETGALANGIYFLEIVSEKGVFVRRFEKID